MNQEQEKNERLNCPFCNPHRSYGASPDFFDQWKIKHEYHSHKNQEKTYEPRE